MRFLGAILVLALAVGGGLAGWYFTRTRSPAPIVVYARGSPEQLAPGTTLGGAARRLGLEPAAGDLLDVRGRALVHDRFPGYLLLNGIRAPRRTLLHSSDRIEIVDGLDRREATKVDTVAVPEGQAAEPQFFLFRTPGEQVIARGVRSGIVLFAYFRPTGEALPTTDVALTFDDGPWPSSTAKILHILARHHVRATFFTIGAQVERYPQLVRDELAAGMVVGNHSYSHPNQPPFAHLSRRRIRQEIAHADMALEQVGDTPRLFRPPGGSYSNFVIEAARKHGLHVVLWSVDPTDWRSGVKAKQIVAGVLDAVRPGSIVLLHDGGGDRSATIKALPKIIRGIRKMGLHLVVI